MSEQREMTLDEWVNRLPDFHLANKEFQQLQQRIAELEAQLKERDEQNEKLFKLARKTLWIAHCWNDHNFGHPQDEVKEMVNAMGFDTLDKANKFLMECEPKEQDHE